MITSTVKVFGNRLTTIESLVRHSVQLNGVSIPVQFLEKTFANYTHPLVVWNNDRTYVCSLIGSCLGIYYRNKHLLLCTRHQLKLLEGRSYENIGLLDRNGDSFCSAGQMIHYNIKINDVVARDLAVFDFTEPCKNRPHMRERFFNLSRLPPNVAADQVVSLVLSGFPSEKQIYNLTEETRELGFAQAVINCSIAPDTYQLKEDSTVLKLNCLSPLNFKPDGMSGGAAFVVQLVNNIGHADFAGMIVMGANNKFHIMKVGSILQTIDTWLDEPKHSKTGSNRTVPKGRLTPAEPEPEG